MKLYLYETQQLSDCQYRSDKRPENFHSLLHKLIQQSFNGPRNIITLGSKAQAPSCLMVSNDLYCALVVIAHGRVSDGGMACGGHSLFCNHQLSQCIPILKTSHFQVYFNVKREHIVATDVCSCWAYGKSAFEKYYQ